MAIFNFFKGKNKDIANLDKGLEKTRESFLSRLGRVFVGKTEINDDFLDELEEALVSSDVGVKTTLRIIDALKEKAASRKFMNQEELNNMLKSVMLELLTAHDKGKGLGKGLDLHETKSPFILMVVGVNGVGKTTSIGKLAHLFKKAGNKVLLIAADTFRAGAVDQLKIWSERAEVDFFDKGMNTDPAAVAYEGIQKAVDEQYDLVIVDTAGRLHNKVNLMNELSKIRRVMSKIIPDAPHEVLLVLDASTGQNAIEQASKFTEATEVTALALTKLDGTAKGGVVIGISDSFKIQVKYIGIGEKMEDLKIFNPEDFISTLFHESKIS
jgi:fused signal recognition particle receptor